MKKNFWLIIGILISTSAWADQPALPAAATATQAEPGKPAKQAAPHAAKTPELRSVPLVAGPAVVAVSPLSRVNVRGKPSLKGEVITRMTNSEQVTVIEEIHLTVSAPEEPSAWAKIVLPEKTHPWVKASYVDQTNMTVKAKKLNLRAGPGENYSIVGSLQAGDAVKEASRKGDWIEIETPPTAYAYMAAQYLNQAPAATTVVSAEPTIEPTNTTTVTEPVLAATAGTTLETPTNVTDVATGTTEEMTSTNAVVEEPPPPRIVQREGIVRGTVSIQAPTRYELISQETRRTIDYLYTTSPELDLSRYKGLHIIVSGEEGLDERWRNTPVLTIKSIHVVD